MEIVCSKLPSLGNVYEQKLDNITIRTLKGKDEKLLAEMNLDNVEKKYFALLKNVVSGIDINKLTLGDRVWLLIWERINSYSPEFPIDLVCEYCYQKIFLKYDLSQIDVKTLPEDFKEPYSITLEDGILLKLRLFRVEDEIKALDWEKSKGSESAYLYRLALSILDEEKNIIEKMAYLEELDVKDLLKIKHFHDEFQHGPDLNNCNYTCPKCGGEGRMALSFRPDFLLPSSREFIRDT